MARPNHPNGRRPRLSLATDPAKLYTAPEDDPTLDPLLNAPLRVWVEGEWVIPGRDGQAKVVKDQLAQLLRQTPLTIYTQRLTSERDTSRRRRHTALGKLDRNEVMQFLQDFPGAMAHDVAKHFYPTAEGADYAAALNRVRMCFHRLTKDHLATSAAGCYYPVHKSVTDENDKRVVVLATTLADMYPELPPAIRKGVAETAVKVLATATTVQTYLSAEEFTKLLSDSIYAGSAAAFATAIRYNERTVQHWLEYGVRGARNVSLVRDFMRNPKTEIVHTLVDSRYLQPMPPDNDAGTRGAPAPDIFEQEERDDLGRPIPPTPGRPVDLETIESAFFGTGKKTENP